MESSHWEKAKELFGRALEHPPDTREAFVRETCRDNEILVRDVLKLLAAECRSSGTFSLPLLSIAGMPSEEPPRFMPPAVIARRYRVVQLIARGGMGDVYEAEDLQLGVRVALKSIRPEIASDQRILELFRNEIQIARRVTHPNVCRIYDLAEHRELGDETNGPPALLLTMELLTGRTLAEHLKIQGPFPPEQAFPIIYQLASALQAAHDAGVIHRDFKPGNVILSPGSGGLRPVVTDFGLAVAREQIQCPPLPDAAGGTPAYMAPEQASGGEVTTATDVYALGLVIAELIGARVQRGSETSAKTVQPGPAFRTWEPILCRCLDANPNQRYSRPLDVAAAVEAAVAPQALIRKHSYSKRVKAAALVAGFGLTTLVAARFGEWNNPAPAIYRRLGPEPAEDMLWRPSPDGRYFAMMDGATGNLGLRDIRTGETQLLTHTNKTSADNQATSAAFSPDGARIAYSWVDFSGTEQGGCELRLLDTRSGQNTVLHRDGGVESCEVAAWSPDGSRVLSRFTMTDFTSQIAVLPVSGGPLTLLGPKAVYGAMTFSPDGDSIVFDAPQRPHSIESDIFEISIYGGPVTTLIQDAASDSVIGFSSDGRQLAFSSDRKGSYGVWALTFSGNRPVGEPVELAHDLGRVAPIGLTRDGCGGPLG